MAEKATYKCSECGGYLHMDQAPEETPECCARPMIKEQPVCTKQTTAEHYRLNDDNEPCDDAREGTR
ncbi:hypothetical protein SAMN02745216_04012 [Desulfatibacillum alkenivorans DSM 16219]|uniref:Desulfoferrodoxin N-terminal domain-containing protein n=1 Tax=Desulfatibacillum alkenivorans DSM 16219 TaxID=1121393 RepID=A0A1M6UYM7_9BACT|nr:hypothetical protein [Desulfatibacillum alkenivorans]SHK74313.1 hypothetical protein SAMN02745216_04012 [Desulfatibacillum alkenivorans DSM 16219]